MTATRSRSEEENYKYYLKSVKHIDCVFCDIKKGNKDTIEETASFKVIKNIFAYSLWDGQVVIDHMLITPNIHTDSLANMRRQDKVEYVDLVEKYEKLGYNIYARAPSSAMKSIVHQHTHLIKTGGGPRRFVLLLRKPYIRIVR